MMRELKRGPYIGVTGFTEFGQQAVPLSHMKGSARLLMVGVLASLKTLRREAGRNHDRFPPLEDIASIFYNDPRALNLIHYNTSEPNSLAGQIAVLRGWVGEHCDGIQLNVRWPQLKELAEIRQQWPAARIVLQCGSGALGGVDYRPDEFRHKLTFYAQDHLIDDVLIDPSGGRGNPLDMRLVEPLVRTLYEGHFPIGIGLAGGLSAATLDVIEPLIRDFPDLSIDAEGGLRTPDDALDQDEVEQYLESATRRFTAVGST